MLKILDTLKPAPIINRDREPYQKFFDIAEEFAVEYKMIAGYLSRDISTLSINFYSSNPIKDSQALADKIYHHIVEDNVSLPGISNESLQYVYVKTVLQYKQFVISINERDLIIIYAFPYIHGDIYINNILQSPFSIIPITNNAMPIIIILLQLYNDILDTDKIDQQDGFLTQESILRNQLSPITPSRERNIDINKCDLL